ncbi:periphilin-1-like isoform X2 [Clupea harengus]|uniref:Periphilin-1-like isoform X2 n=1 Tax=Clupea harengus TaxID=7950 RepID=A0A6P3W9F7_CLUHA|nr:periphilin-1-like isoform X2 [Clupea harengus]
MSYRRERSIREVYEERLADRAPYQRVVSIERRAPFPRPEDDYDRGGDYEDQRYGGPRGYPADDERGFHGEDQRGYHSENMHFGNERRNAPPHYKRDDPYPYYRGPREDLPAGRQVEFRSSSRVAAAPSVRGQRPPPPRSMPTAMPSSGDDTLMQAILNLDRPDDHEGPRRKGPVPPVRERSPVKRDVPPSPHSRSGSNISSRSFSPDAGKSYPYPNQHKKRYEEPYGPSQESERERPSGYTISTSRDGSPHSSVLATKEDIPGLSLEQDDLLKEEPVKDTDDFQERRAQAIAAKALEIEKLYRQDCETFGTVVKMLVSKEPGLEKQLQGPLKDSLVEIRERCLEGLRLYINELDEVMLKHEASA